MPDVKKYAVKEIFATLQGEGSRTGARSVFVRFAGCNLWDGRPEHRDRGHGACSLWCDTDFVGGTKMSANDISDAVHAAWNCPPTPGPTWVVISGGEPGLQLDKVLLDTLHASNCRVAVETNGSVANPAFADVDHLTVSPKIGPRLVINSGTELKVVLPGVADGVGWTDSDLADLENTTHFTHLYLQPQDFIDPRFVQVTALHRNLSNAKPGTPLQEVGDSLYRERVAKCLEFIARHPRWRLSLQTHKYIELP